MASLHRRLKKKAQWLRHTPRGAGHAPPTGGHRYIEIARYHRNQKNAEGYVLNMFRVLEPAASIPLPQKDLLFSRGVGADQFQTSFRSAVLEARERGTAEALRSYLNGNDPYFFVTIGVSTDDEGGATLELGFAGDKMALSPPMRQESIESALTDDILEHRRRASEFSLKGYDHFQTTGMHFRGFLLESCALVEAFLNRCVRLAIAAGRKSEALEGLQRPSSVERRFELWLGEFSGDSLSAVTQGVEWDHYTELRRLRNSLMHATHSMLGISVKDTARQLNLVRHGVGGLLNLLRRRQALPPVPFAERLETAPECVYHSQRL